MEIYSFHAFFLAVAHYIELISYVNLFVVYWIKLKLFTGCGPRHVSGLKLLTTLKTS